MNPIELLAPAKDLECGIAAVKCGADALYMGPPSFGARSSAGNSIFDIEKLVTFSHKYMVKVYITVNTILSDEEISEGQRLIKELYNAGADGIIIQDMGLLELDLPPIPLIASTQCHNANWQKVLFLEHVGFQRAILARELSIEQIKEIRDKTNIELEFFIHGSLCVCYSGQCYMSYALGGRSGNRGVCAQLCRKLYSLVTSSGKVIEKERYLLSLKDLNLSGHIKELVEAGISSFKIEGRLKDINYVKNTVTFYRYEIDKVLSELDLKKTSSGEIYADFQPDPSRTFNRGYTDYFIKGRKKDITSFDTPKSRGKILGKVKLLRRDSFSLDGEITASKGDGICFFDEKNGLKGTLINKFEDSFIYPESMKYIKKNTIIYRNLDLDFLKKLKTAHIERRIPVKLIFSEEEKSLSLLIICDEDISVSEELPYLPEIAENKERALENIKKQLSKLGETEFILKEIEINLKNIYFIPVKILNELRRNAIENLRKKRIESYERSFLKIEKNSYPFPEKTLSYSGNVMNKYARKFYKRHGAEIIDSAAEKGIDLKNKKVMTLKHCLKYHFNLCPKYGYHSEETLYLTDEKGKKYPLEFNCKDCEMGIVF